MSALRQPRNAHIAKLLADDAELREALAAAKSADEANAYRADLYAVRRSLWLAGYSPEPEA